MPRRTKKTIRNKSVDQQQTKMLMTLKRRVQSISPPEIKRHTIYTNTYIDHTNALVTASVTGGISPGTGIHNRVGDDISVKSIRMRVHAALGTLSPNYIRVMLVLDKRYQGTPLTGQDVLEYYSVTSGSFENAHSPVNDSFMSTRGSPGSVQILYDRVMWVNTYNTLTVANFNKRYKRGLPIKYEGANPAPGQIYLLVFPGKDTTDSQNPQYGFSVQVKYTDI